MKSLILVTTIILSSFAAQAGTAKVRCTLNNIQKDAMTYINIKLREPGTLLVGPCLAEAVDSARAEAILTTGQEIKADERFVESVALKIKADLDKDMETASVKAEIFEQQMKDVDFPKFLDDEADLKRQNPLEGVEN